jgi:hypothetical protein
MAETSRVAHADDVEVVRPVELAGTRTAEGNQARLDAVKVLSETKHHPLDPTERGREVRGHEQDARLIP